MILFVFWLVACVCFLGGWLCGWAISVQTAEYRCPHCGTDDFHTSTCVANYAE